MKKTRNNIRVELTPEESGMLRSLLASEIERGKAWLHAYPDHPQRGYILESVEAKGKVRQKITLAFRDLLITTEGLNDFERYLKF